MERAAAREQAAVPVQTVEVLPLGDQDVHRGRRIAALVAAFHRQLLEQLRMASRLRLTRQERGKMRRIRIQASHMVRKRSACSPVAANCGGAGIAAAGACAHGNPAGMAAAGAMEGAIAVAPGN